jgi:hypothetical protein
VLKFYLMYVNRQGFIFENRNRETLTIDNQENECIIVVAYGAVVKLSVGAGINAPPPIWGKSMEHHRNSLAA